MTQKFLCISIILFFLFLTSPLNAKSKKDPTPGLRAFTGLIISGNHEDALKLLKKENIKKWKGRFKHRLQFMQAYSHFKAGEYKQAVDIFKELQKDYEVLKDYIDFYLALAYRGAGEPKETVKILTDLKKSKPSHHISKQIDRELALAHCGTKDRSKAISLFNQLIQSQPNPNKTYHLRFDRSRCLIQLGQPDEALITLRSLYLNYPEGDLSEKILELIDQSGKSQTLTISDHLARARQLMANKRPSLAASDLEQVLKRYGANAPLSVRLDLAQAYFKSRQYPKAATAYEMLRSHHPGAFGNKERLRLAQAYARSDQFDKAISAYEELRDAGGGGSSATMDYKLAFLYMDKGSLKEANRRFENVLSSYPKHHRRDAIHWFLAWNHYLLKNYDQALTYLNALESGFSRSRYSKRVPYWRARVYEKLGKNSLAKSQYQQIVERDPFSYYGFMSLKRLENNLDLLQAPRKSWAQELPRLQVPRTFNFSDNSGRGKKEVQVLEELVLVGLWEDFLGELGNLTSKEGVSGTIRDLKRDMDGLSSGSYSGGQWSANYPAAYATLVSLFSKSRDFPMALTWAIMREESRFKIRAVSGAQAIGLMQIIPPTGAEIAQDLGRKGYVPDWLYEPVTNIEFGVHYLNKNRKRFNGRVPETIASYNAGPDAVTRWTTTRPGREFDEFIEEIPYKETNNYVKKVLKSFYIYQLMYGDG